jgi:23S rRNA pseudouridine2605 synthase
MPKSTTPEKETLRLNRFLAEAGVCSRRNADALIADGHVTINRKRATLGMQVAPEDTVMVDGKAVGHRHRHTYVLLNKPKDCVTTSSDERGRRTVIEIVGHRERIFPVGRLDRNSTGVLLLMTDGDLAHRLMHPRYEVEKTYLVQLESTITRQTVQQLEKGILLDGEMTAPVKIEVNPRDPSVLTLAMHEGKNRQVRRMFEEMGLMVNKLERVVYAGLTTKGVPRGAWRTLSGAEVARLRKLVKLDA